MKKLIAEALATFGLVFLGTGAIIVHQETTYKIGQIGIAIAFGVGVTSMIYAFRKQSGAHMNPAVTIALSVLGKHPKREVIPYVFAQIIGGLCASLLLVMLFPTSELLGASMPSGTELESFLWELVLTFILMLVVLISTKGNFSDKYIAPTAIGGTVLLEAYFLGPICGASMNPARSITPAVISGHLEHLWIYIVATVLGALLAVGSWALIYNKKVD
ncbi:MAG: aquaporin [Crocinitomicaceae bacterium]|nr:aquaporin [Crocinitomicaceae bacterium]